MTHTRRTHQDPHQPTPDPLAMDRAKPSSIASRLFPHRLAITPEEFARAANVGRTSIYLALQRNELPHRRIGRRILIPLDALDRWLG